MRCFLFTLLLFSALPAFAQTEYTAHEWGTFTTLCGSTGQRLNGLYLEEEELPYFVYSHKGISPNPLIRFPGEKEEQRYFMFCDHVSVKMETPVIYFYSDKSFDVNAEVRFPNGTISQWYPYRVAGDEITGEKIDLSTPYNGFIKWKARVLAPNDPSEYAHTTDVTSTWNAPRATDANKIISNGQVEKYLFYRGIGNFDLPVKLKFITSAELEITNESTEAIPYFFVFDMLENGSAAVWWSGAIKAGESKKVTEPYMYYNLDHFTSNFSEFENALINAGLYKKEAAAMLKTWETSYFQTEGMKVFWIVPRSFIDEILPLKLDPQPKNLERVLIGRSEILKPQLEKKLMKYYSDKTPGVGNSRYVESLKERVQQLKINPADTVSIVKPLNNIAQIEINNIKAYPNPAKNALTIELNSTKSDISITLYNLLGVPVYFNSINGVSGSYKNDVDISNLAPGNYILKVAANDQQYIQRIVKQ